MKRSKSSNGRKTFDVSDATQAIEEHLKLRPTRPAGSEMQQSSNRRERTVMAPATSNTREAPIFANRVAFRMAKVDVIETQETGGEGVVSLEAAFADLRYDALKALRVRNKLISNSHPGIECFFFF